MLSNAIIPSLLYLGILIALGGLALSTRLSKMSLAFLGLCIADIGYACIGFSIPNDAAYVGSIALVSFNLIARLLGFIALFRIINAANEKGLGIAGIAKELPYSCVVFALSLFAAIEIAPFFTPDAKHYILYGAVLLGSPEHIATYGITAVISAINIAKLVLTLLIAHKLFEGSNYTYKAMHALDDFKSSPALLHILFALLIVFGLSSHEFVHYLITNYSSQPFTLYAKFPDFNLTWSIETIILYAGAALVFICGLILPKARKTLALVLMLAAFAVTVFDNNLIELSYFFAVLSAFMGVIVTLFSFGYIKHNENSYYALLLLMFASISGLLTSTNSGSFFTFWEIMTISSYVLVAFDDTPKAHYAAKKYFLMSGIGALFMLPALLALQLHQPHELYTMMISGVSINVFIYACIIGLFIGLGVKAGIFPFHSWLPDAHPAAPASISAPLSGILTKTGLYGMLLFFSTLLGFGFLQKSFVCPFFNLPSLGVLLMLLGIVTMFYGEIMAYKAEEIKRLFAYSTIGQIGEICMTFGVFSYLATTGVLLHIFNHAIMKDLIFLCTGAFMLRSGFTKIQDLKGLGKVMPFTATCMVIGLLSILGLPPFAGFNSKFIMLFGLAEYSPYLAALMLLASFIGVVYYTRVIRILVFEKYTGPKVEDATLPMKIAMGILALACVVFGLYPQLVLDNLIAPITALIAAKGGFNLSEQAVNIVALTTVTWKSPAIIILLGAVLPVIVRKNPLQCGIASTLVLTVAAIALVATMGQYDTLSFIFAMGITVIGATTACYSIGYMEHYSTQWRYYASFLCMVGGLVGVATSANLYSFFFFWEIMSSWTLYFVIIHDETAASLWEGFKYFLFNVIGAGFLFLGVILAIHWLGTPEFAGMNENFANLDGAKITTLFALLTIGFLMKAAQLPFRIDIQMHPATAPTPVSGYISAVLLKSALFGLAKLFLVFGGVSLIAQHINLAYISEIALYIGAVTIVMAASFAVFQTNIKLVLIYSTVSQLGYMVVGIALGTSLGVAGGLLHLVNHLFFKDLLFLVAGVIIAQTHILSMDKMGGLGLKMPKTLALFAIGAVCVIGLPPSSGFTSKWIIYHALMDQGYVLPAILSLVGSVLTLAYMTKFLHSVFLGQVKPSMETVHEAPKSMLIPMSLVALGCVITSVFPGVVLLAINKILVSVNLQALDVAPWGINSGKGAWNATLTAILFFVVWYVGQRTLRKFSRQERRTAIFTCGNPAENFGSGSAQDIYSPQILFNTATANENK